MEPREYAVLGGVALVTVAVGVATTSQPLGAFFVESLRQFLSTTASMVWITWWALVFGFAIAGGVEGFPRLSELKRRWCRISGIAAGGRVGLVGHD